MCNHRKYISEMIDICVSLNMLQDKLLLRNSNAFDKKKVQRGSRYAMCERCTLFTLINTIHGH